MDCIHEVMNPCAVVLSDERQRLIFESMAKESDCREAGPEPFAKVCFLPLTPGEYTGALDCLVEGGAAVCHSPSPELAREAASRGVRLVDLALDESFLKANAVITAECALGMLILDTGMSLRDGKFAVFGGGRIAGALTQMLTKLDAGLVVVFARSPMARENARYVGAHAVSIDDAGELEGCDALFNTIPAMVIGQDALGMLARGALVYELASSPGFDQSLASSMGLRVVKAGGLPGRYAPKSAADLVIRHALKQLTEE